MSNSYHFGTEISRNQQRNKSRYPDIQGATCGSVAASEKQKKFDLGYRVVGKISVIRI